MSCLHKYTQSLEAKAQTHARENQLRVARVFPGIMAVQLHPGILKSSKHHHVAAYFPDMRLSFVINNQQFAESKAPKPGCDDGAVGMGDVKKGAVANGRQGVSHARRCTWYVNTHTDTHTQTHTHTRIYIYIYTCKCNYHAYSCGCVCVDACLSYADVR